MTASRAFSLHQRFAHLALSVAAASLLSACATSESGTATTASTPNGSTRAITGVSVMTPQGLKPVGPADAAAPATAASAGAPGETNEGLPTADPNDPVAQAVVLAAKAQANPDDIDAQIAFSAALRRIGAGDSAVTALKPALVRAPDHPGLQAEYGKALVAAGRAKDALPFLSRAAQMQGSDWEMLSAEGVAYDQLARHDEAKSRYEAALRLAPGEVTLLNNLGLNRALAGDLDSAERYLSEAAANPAASARIRQNLALVLGLKGDLSAAERVSREDLSPAQARNNVQFYQQFTASAAPKPITATPAP